jgi:glyoxylase-like metal-dependent hydrolase (beta-lactamase superfamily II)/rhodanese-related sulfurtransferase
MQATRISTEELQDLLATGQPVTVVDIRTPTDREWSIPGSVQIDAYDAVKSGGLGPLADREFSPGPVVTVCETGRTAATATGLPRAKGVEALTLEGGMRAWSLAWNIAQTTISDCGVVQVRRTGKGCLSYIVESGSKAVVIDASLDPDVYVRLLRERGWRLVAAVDTHIHADHVSRSRLLAQEQGVEFWLPAQGRTQYPFRHLTDGGRLPFGSAELVAVATPGHTAESTTYLLDSAAAFTGDTLLLAGVGRPDLEGGQLAESASRARLLYGSISRLLRLPETTLVLPGHVSEPVPFDGRLLATTVETIRDTVALAGLEPAAFVEAVLGRIPPNPPNHSIIVELNERGELPEDPSELEAGANRCAVA